MFYRAGPGPAKNSIFLWQIFVYFFVLLQPYSTYNDKYNWHPGYKKMFETKMNQIMLCQILHETMLFWPMAIFSSINVWKSCISYIFLLEFNFFWGLKTTYREIFFSKITILNVLLFQTSAIFSNLANYNRRDIIYMCPPKWSYVISNSCVKYN